MRCDEARRKLNELSSAGSDPAGDGDLQNHLRSCPACARQARAAELIREDFVRARVDDEVDVVPFAALKAEVETRATLASRSPRTVIKERKFMSALKNQLGQRPRLGVGVVVVAVVLLAATLIPFKYDRTVGYEVAFAGVHKDLAEDEIKLQELLTRIGFEGATVEVSDCDATCTVTIKDLSAPSDAVYLTKVFESVDGEGHITMDISAMEISEEHSILVYIGDKIKGGGHVDGDSETHFYSQLMDLDSAHRVVLELIGEDADPETQKWIQAHAGDHKEVSIRASGMSLSGGEMQEIYLTADSVDQDLVDALNAKGFRVVIKDREGNILLNSSPETSESNDPVAKLQESSELPEGYSLSQNYPNPFNPTTTMTFSLPSAQPVTLEVYNIQGQLVRTLYDGVAEAGEHTVMWDATTDDGSKVASGVYLYRLAAGEVSQTKKMIFAK